MIRKLRAGVMPPPDRRVRRSPNTRALRDWLEAEIDRATRGAPPPDDSAARLRQHRRLADDLADAARVVATAAARVARMAVGYWKSPTEATYLRSSDASQNHRLEGCRSARAAASSRRHDFPADGEYKFSIQNFGIGSFIPGEQLALIIDGERAHVWPYRGVGMAWA